MSRTITIKISGSGADTDAPTAEDLLAQIQDYLDILKGVEAALAEDGKNTIQWRVVDASKHSPLQIQLASFSREYAVNVDRRAEVVTRSVAEGLSALQARPDRPRFFNDEILNKAERTFERVTNGLNLSEIDFGPDINPLRITPVIARSAAKNVKLALNPVERPYQELGSVEGSLHKVGKDHRGRSVAWVRLRLNGDVVKCILGGNALKIVSQHDIGEVLRGHRLLVLGTIRYKSLGQITQVDASEVRFFPAKSEVPSVDDILDENFTGGLSSEEYLERFRDGKLS